MEADALLNRFLGLGFGSNQFNWPGLNPNRAGFDKISFIFPSTLVSSSRRWNHTDQSEITSATSSCSNSLV
jgi:hypothetical protein